MHSYPQPLNLTQIQM